MNSLSLMARLITSFMLDIRILNCITNSIMPSVFLYRWPKDFARSVIEYLGHGFPVIVTPCATCDVVISGKNGFIIDYDNIQQITDKILHFSNDVEQFKLLVTQDKDQGQIKDMSIYVDEVIHILESM